MKRTLLTLIYVFLACSPIFAQKKAADYMNAIGKEYKAVINDVWLYSAATIHGKMAQKLEPKRKELIKQVAAAALKINKMNGFDDDVRFRDSAQGFMQQMNAMLTEDFVKVIDLQSHSEESFDAMEAFIRAQESLDEKFNKLATMMFNEEEKFASDNGLASLEKKNKLAAKMEAADRVYKYYNTMYMIFFKANKDESYLLDAQNKADLEMMDKSQAWLTETSTMGLEDMKYVKDFDGDNTLKSACTDLLRFYQLESGKKFQESKNFFVKKDAFNKAKAIYDAKGEDRTKQEISAFNKANNEYNNAQTKYSGNNQILIDKRKALMDAWNKAQTDFLLRHIPAK